MENFQPASSQPFSDLRVCLEYSAIDECFDHGISGPGNLSRPAGIFLLLRVAP